jgi:hypothetical protein
VTVEPTKRTSRLRRWWPGLLGGAVALLGVGLVVVNALGVVHARDQVVNLRQYGRRAAAHAWLRTSCSTGRTTECHTSEVDLSFTPADGPPVETFEDRLDGILYVPPGLASAADPMEVTAVYDPDDPSQAQVEGALAIGVVTLVAHRWVAFTVALALCAVGGVMVVVRQADARGSGRADAAVPG